MEMLYKVFDFFLHLDKHLSDIVSLYGTWTYSILFVIIFCETGLVVTPFLPGDSLLFAAGAIAGLGGLDIWSLILILCLAAVIGDTVNYHIGLYIGPKVFKIKDSKIFKQEYLERTERFYEKHGAKTIIIARFVPIIRTFAPFVAGVGKMSYLKFIRYNIIGGIAWVFGFAFAGYWFGQRPIVKENFTLVIFAIIIISVMPAVIEIIKAHWEKKSMQRNSFRA